MMIKISPTCWLNPQDVSAVIVCKQIHAERDDTTNIEFSLHGGQTLQIESTIPFSEAESFLDELADKINAEETDNDRRPMDKTPA